MNKVIISVGSNIDPEKNIHSSHELICKNHNIVKESKFEYTKPIGYLKQADFLNGAYLVLTYMDIKKFKSNLKSIEEDLGRSKSSNRFGPRTIDLDIIVWNDKIVDDDFFNRDFVNKFVSQLM